MAWIFTILNSFGVIAMITFLFMECFWPESIPDMDNMGDCPKKDKGEGDKSKEEPKADDEAKLIGAEAPEQDKKEDLSACLLQSAQIVGVCSLVFVH